MSENGRRDPGDGAESDRPRRNASGARNSGNRDRRGSGKPPQRDGRGWRDSRDDRGGKSGGPRREGQGGREDRRQGGQRDDRRTGGPRQDRDRKPGKPQWQKDRGENRDRRGAPQRRDSRPPRAEDKPVDDAALAKELLEAPELPEGIEYSDLDEEARRELRTLPKALAETVGKHLVAAGGLMDTDAEAALAHAKYAKAKASRVPIVREALGLVAYHAGQWSEALSELRAVRRMTRTDTHIAVIADAERAMGRPERALDLAKEVNTAALPREVQIELKIVAAGARRDLGQLDAAVVSLQGEDLKPGKREPWSARLFYAYADNLAAAGRRDEAIQWFLHAADADTEEETDAPERAAELADE